jgi:hypothetical protein
LISSAEFDDAIGDFSLAHAVQAEYDHTALNVAVRKERIAVYQGTSPTRPTGPH